MSGAHDTAGLVPSPQNLRSCLVVGSGVAGLQVAKQLLSLNCHVIILEANCDIGGVWLTNYVNYGLQVPWRCYQFPDFLWPASLRPSQEYPTGQQVQAYIRAYAEHFDLLRHVRLNCKLLRLRWDPAARTWGATYSDTARSEIKQVAVDYVVVCSGIYSNPFIPEIEGSDTFTGMHLHAKDFTDLSVVRGRRVLVVGAGKTAMDCVDAIAGSRSAASVTLLHRKAHWPIPRKLLGMSISKVIYNRAMAGMLPPYYDAGPVRRAVGAAAAPLKWLFWRSIEGVIIHQSKLSKDFRPHVPLPADLFYGGQILDVRSETQMRRKWGDVDTIRNEIRRFTPDGVVLKGGQFLKVDAVLYCTGYANTYEYFDEETRGLLGLQKDGLYLYRNCLPPDVPNLAFVGSEVSTFNNILTHGLQALWLAHVLSGRITLPRRERILADLHAQQRWRRTVMPPQRRRGAILQLYMQDYHDQLLRDMGHSPRRKGLANPFAECFGAYTAKDYADLSVERQNADQGQGQGQGREQLQPEVDTCLVAAMQRAAEELWTGSGGPAAKSGLRDASVGVSMDADAEAKAMLQGDGSGSAAATSAAAADTSASAPQARGKRRHQATALGLASGKAAAPGTLPSSGDHATGSGGSISSTTSSNRNSSRTQAFTAASAASAASATGTTTSGGATRRPPGGGTQSRAAATPLCTAPRVPSSSRLSRVGYATACDSPAGECAADCVATGAATGAAVAVPALAASAAVDTRGGDGGSGSRSCSANGPVAGGGPSEPSAEGPGAAGCDGGDGDGEDGVDAAAVRPRLRQPLNTRTPGAHGSAATANCSSLPGSATAAAAAFTLTMPAFASLSSDAATAASTTHCGTLYGSALADTSNSENGSRSSSTCGGGRGDPGGGSRGNSGSLGTGDGPASSMPPAVSESPRSNKGLSGAATGRTGGKSAADVTTITAPTAGLLDPSSGGAHPWATESCAATSIASGGAHPTLSIWAASATRSTRGSAGQHSGPRDLDDPRAGPAVNLAAHLGGERLCPS